MERLQFTAFMQGTSRTQQKPAPNLPLQKQSPAYLTYAGLFN